MSSVSIARSTRSTSSWSPANVSTGPVGTRRVVCTVCRSAKTAAIRLPVTKLVRSSQCVPMSATARRAPPWPGSSRQFQSVGFSSQSWT